MLNFGGVTSFPDPQKLRFFEKNRTCHQISPIISPSPIPPIIVTCITRRKSPSHPPTWRIIPLSKWLGSPPFISHLGHLEGNNQILRGLTITMVINHLPPSWHDPPSNLQGPPTKSLEWFVDSWVAASCDCRRYMLGNKYRTSDC